MHTLRTLILASKFFQKYLYNSSYYCIIQSFIIQLVITKVHDLRKNIKTNVAGYWKLANSKLLLYYFIEQYYHFREIHVGKDRKNIKKRRSNQNKETYLEILRMENCIRIYVSSLTNQVLIGSHVYLIQMELLYTNLPK